VQFKDKKLVSDSFCMDFEFLQKVLKKIYWFLIGPKQSIGLLKLYFMPVSLFKDSN